MVNQVVMRQTVDFPEIDDEGLTVILRVGRRGKEMQTLDSSLQHLVPAPFAGKGGIDVFELGEREDGAGGDEPSFPLFQVATLGQDDEVVFDRCPFLRLSLRL